MTPSLCPIRALTLPGRRRAAVAAALSCLLSATLTAHGGQYRGPTLGGALATPNARPVPPGMVTGGPLTGGNANLDVGSWRVWWELNLDRYVGLERDGAPGAAAVSASLVRALDRTDNPDVNSASLIALGKAGVDGSDLRVLDVLRARLTRSNVEVREAAVLALGISGRPEAFDDLDALVRDTARGRRIVGREQVGDRVRTFAAYSIGLLAQRSDDAALEGKALASLVAALGDRRAADRDVLTGVLNGIRLIDPDPAKGARHKRVLWTAVAALEEYLQVRFKDWRAEVQSHALTALAALLGRGDGIEQDRARALVTDWLKRPRAEAMVYRSATIALGEMLRPGDEESLEILARRVAQPPDSLVPKLGMIAFGKIGGETSLEQLRRAYLRSKRDVQAWAAVGLGVLAFHAPRDPVKPPQGQAIDLRREAGELLLAGLRKNRNNDVRAATAIGLGLAGCDQAIPELRKLLAKYLTNGELSGHLCVSLAMLGDAESIPSMRSAMTRPDPQLLAHAGLALARLGQRDASATAVAALQSGRLSPYELPRLAAAVKAIGYLKNPRDLDALGRLVDRATRGPTQHLRTALAAAALGSVADGDRIGFGARIAPGMNYTGNVQTVSNGRSGILDIF